LVFVIFEKINRIMQIKPEYEHLFRKESDIINYKKDFNMFSVIPIRCKLVEVNGERYLCSFVNMSPGDTVIDVAALENGYTDVIRTCEDQEDADFLNGTKGLYQKVLASKYEIGAQIFEGSVMHDRVLEMINGVTIEIAHPDFIREIIDNGGECFSILDDGEIKKFQGYVALVSSSQVPESYKEKIP
jgi:hypothetical protein